MAGFRRAGVYPFNLKAIAVPENDSSLSSASPQSSGSLSGAFPQSSGSLSGASPQSSGSLSGASPQSSGSLSGASTQSSGSLSGASPQSSGSLSGVSPQSSGSLSGTSPQSSGGSSGTPGGMSDSSTCQHSPTFTSEQLDRFKIRYEEGYDVYEDSDYVRWLELNHPEAVPTDRYSLVSSVEDPQNASGIDSLVEHFSEVNPLGAIADNIPSNSSVNNNSSNTPVVSTPRSEVNALSKNLVLPGTSTPSGPKKAPPRARLLTSAEKEQKKQKEPEEEQKKEREEKKRQRRNANGKLKRKLGRQKRGKKRKPERQRKKLAKRKRNLKKARIDMKRKAKPDGVNSSNTRSECVLDNDGKERLCPFCLDILS